MNELTATQKTILEAAINHLNGSIHPLPGNINGGAAKKVIKSMLKNGLIEEDGVESWRITETGYRAIGLTLPQVETTTDESVEDKTTTDDPNLEEDIAMAEQALAEMAADFEGAPATDEQVEDEQAADEQVEDEQAADEQVADEPVADMEAEVAAEADCETPEAESQPAFVDEPDPDYWAIAIKQFPNLTRTEWPPIRNIIEDAYILGYNAKPARRPKVSHESKPRQPRTDSKQARVIELMRRPEGATLAQIADATEWQLHTIRAFISTSKKKGMEITTNHVRTVGPNQQGSPGSTTTYFIN